MPPVRHVILALSFAGILFVIAGDRWSANIGKIKPVRTPDGRGF